MNRNRRSSRQATYSGKNEKSRVQISKDLSYYLRHEGVRRGLIFDEQGWTNLSLLLQQPRLKLVSLDTVKEIVSTCCMQRYALTEREGQLFIRANHGHSLQKINPDLEELTLDTLPEVIIYGTSKNHWENIKISGLHQRPEESTRIYIHLYSSFPRQDEVISGVRWNDELYIYIDAAKAIADGIPFFRTQNNRILCPGNGDGILESKYFSKVEEVRADGVFRIQ